MCSQPCAATAASSRKKRGRSSGRRQRQTRRVHNPAGVLTAELLVHHALELGRRDLWLQGTQRERQAGEARAGGLEALGSGALCLLTHHLVLPAPLPPSLAPMLLLIAGLRCVLQKRWRGSGICAEQADGTAKRETTLRREQPEHCHLPEHRRLPPSMLARPSLPCPCACRLQDALQGNEAVNRRQLRIGAHKKRDRRVLIPTCRAALRHPPAARLRHSTACFHVWV